MSEAIGEVECPHKVCTKVCKVYAFQPRTDGRRSVFTGKKYLKCPDHGRIGADGSQAVTDYILEKGTIWGANRPAAEPEKPAGNPPRASAPPGSKPAPKNPQSTPATRPASSSKQPPNPQPKLKWWDPAW